MIAAEVLSTTAAIFPCESDTAHVPFATSTPMIRWASLELVIVPIRVKASCPTRAAQATVRVQTTKPYDLALPERPGSTPKLSVDKVTRDLNDLSGRLIPATDRNQTPLDRHQT